MILLIVYNSWHPRSVRKMACFSNIIQSLTGRQELSNLIKRGTYLLFFRKQVLLAFLFSVNCRGYENPTSKHKKMPPHVMNLAQLPEIKAFSGCLFYMLNIYFLKNTVFVTISGVFLIFISKMSRDFLILMDRQLISKICPAF